MKTTRISTLILIGVFLAAGFLIVLPEIKPASAMVIYSHTIATDNYVNYASFSAVSDFSIKILMNVPNLSTIGEGTNYLHVTLSHVDGGNDNQIDMHVYSDAVQLYFLSNYYSMIHMSSPEIISTSVSVGTNITLLFIHDGNATLYRNNAQFWTCNTTIDGGPSYHFNGGFDFTSNEMDTQGWVGNAAISMVDSIGNIFYSYTLTPVYSSDSGSFSALWDFVAPIEVEISDLDTRTAWTNFTRLYLYSGDFASSIDIAIFSDDILLQITDNSAGMIPGGFVEIPTTVSFGSNITILFVHNANVTLFNDGIEIYSIPVNTGDGYPTGWQNSYFSMGGTGNSTATINDELPSGTVIFKKSTSINYLEPLVWYDGDQAGSLNHVVGYGHGFNLTDRLDVVGLDTYASNTSYSRVAMDGGGDGLAIFVYSDGVWLNIANNTGVLNPDTFYPIAISGNEAVSLVYTFNVSFVLSVDSTVLATISAVNNNFDGSPELAYYSTSLHVASGSEVYTVASIGDGTLISGSNFHTEDFVLSYDVEISDLEPFGGTNQTFDYIMGGSNRVDLYVYSNAISVYVVDNGVELINNPLVYTSVSLGDNITEKFVHDGNVTVFKNGVKIYSAPVTGGDGFPSGFDNISFFAFGTGNVTATLYNSASDIVAPTYSGLSVSSTVAGSSCQLSHTWTDETALSGYIVEHNNTGTPTNTTWAAFSSNPQTVTTAITLNSTVGNHIQWRVFANDTSNNWNATGLQTITLTGYGITPSADAHSTITPSSEVTLPFGGSQQFNMTAGTGYHIASVLVDSVDQGAISTYTFTAVSANHTVSAASASNPVTTTHQIAASHGTGGTITPDGTISVVDGTDSAFALTPNTGYRIYAAAVDGAAISVPNAYGFTYTFTNVIADHTITVHFRVVPTTPDQTDNEPPPAGPFNVAALDMGTHMRNESFTVTLKFTFAANQLTLTKLTLPSPVAGWCTAELENPRFSVGVGELTIHVQIPADAADGNYTSSLKLEATDGLGNTLTASAAFTLTVSEPTPKMVAVPWLLIIIGIAAAAVIAGVSLLMRRRR